MENEQIKKPKKGLRIPNFFKSKAFAFGLTIFLFIIAAFVLVGMDAENTIRPNWPIFQWIQSVFKTMGIKPFNVTIWSWFGLTVFFVLVFAVLIFIFWSKKYVESRNNHHLRKTGVEYSVGRKRLIRVAYALVIAVIIAAAILCFWFFMPANWKEWFLHNKFNGYTLLNIVTCVGIIILFMLIPPLAILGVIIVFELIIKLLAVIIGGISRNVLASQAYQEAKVATDIANQKLKNAATKGMRGDTDKNANNRESPYAEYLFPALMVIDHKWEGILKEREEAAAKAEEEAKQLPAPEAEAEEDLPTESTVSEETAVDVNAEGDISNEMEAISSSKMNYDQFKKFAYEFQSFLCARKYYFDINILRSFISGLGAARLILLEGLSGTGKSTLPRMFLEYVGGKAYFFPVQATWRDRSDITGYYSDFTGEFKETELLKHLYEASYTPELVNLMVLDEMNISRVEYYFADFLSIFEYPSSDWLVPLMQVKLGTTVPKYIEGGSVRIPENTWFVGTVNIDDSTFTITDKVYDRAIVIDFKELNIPFTSQYNSDPHPVSMYEFNDMFAEAKARPENHLSDAQRKKFLELCNFVADTFDLRFGNRIMNQIDNFLPIFVALGGTKEAALDIMFARKILRKLDGKFESYIKDGLAKLSRYINQAYGKHVFKETEALIENLRRKLS